METGSKKVSKAPIIIIAIAIVIAAIALFLGLGGGKKGYRIIRMMAAVGDVFINRGSSGEISVYEGMNLESGDSMRTGAESYSRLALDEDKVVLVEEKSRVDFNFSKSGNDSLTYIDIAEGAVVNEIEKPLTPASVYEVTTPNATMACRGTRFRVSTYIGEDGRTYTRLSTLEGKVACRRTHPDGTKDTEEILIETNNETLIYHDKEQNIVDYVYFDNDGNIMTRDELDALGLNPGDFSNTRPIDFSDMPTQVLEYFEARMEEGVVYDAIDSGKREEIEGLIAGGSGSEPVITSSAIDAGTAAAAEAVATDTTLDRADDADAAASDNITANSRPEEGNTYTPDNGRNTTNNTNINRDNPTGQNALTNTGFNTELLSRLWQPAGTDNNRTEAQINQTSPTGGDDDGGDDDNGDKKPQKESAAIEESEEESAEEPGTESEEESASEPESTSEVSSEEASEEASQEESEEPNIPPYTPPEERYESPQYKLYKDGDGEEYFYLTSDRFSMSVTGYILTDGDKAYKSEDNWYRISIFVVDQAGMEYFVDEKTFTTNNVRNTITAGKDGSGANIISNSFVKDARIKAVIKPIEYGGDERIAVVFNKTNTTTTPPQSPADIVSVTVTSTSGTLYCGESGNIFDYNLVGATKDEVTKTAWELIDGVMLDQATQIDTTNGYISISRDESSTSLKVKLTATIRGKDYESEMQVRISVGNSPYIIKSISFDKDATAKDQYTGRTFDRRGYIFVKVMEDGSRKTLDPTESCETDYDTVAFDSPGQVDVTFIYTNSETQEEISNVHKITVLQDAFDFTLAFPDTETVIKRMDDLNNPDSSDMGQIRISLKDVSTLSGRDDWVNMATQVHIESDSKNYEVQSGGMSPIAPVDYTGSQLDLNVNVRPLPSASSYDVEEDFTVTITVKADDLPITEKARSFTVSILPGSDITS